MVGKLGEVCSNGQANWNTTVMCCQFPMNGCYCGSDDNDSQSLDDVYANL